MGKSHTFNATTFVRDTHPGVALDNIASPIEDFRDLLQNTKPRKLKMRERYGKRKKLRNMMYCLAEAHRRATQCLFATTPQASIMQDGADSKLFARYACCTNQLQRTNGHLGVFNFVAKHKAADSLALAHSMDSIVKEACTEWSGVPFKSKK